MNHISSGDLELYALGRLGPAQDAEIEEHLIICQHCRDELTREEFAIRSIQASLASRIAAHDTGEGMVELWLERRGRSWVGRMDRHEILCVRRGSNWTTTFTAITTAFAEAYPEHACSSACMVAEEKGCSPS